MPHGKKPKNEERRITDRARHFSEKATGRYDNNLKTALRQGDTMKVNYLTQNPR